jgi:hypothetical protein
VSGQANISESGKMRKIVFGVAILLAIAMVLPAMAVPLDPKIIMKVNGGGWYESYEGIKWIKTFTAQMDSFGTVKGQWQAQSPSPGPGTWHADVTLVETGIFSGGPQSGKTGAVVVGVVTSAEDPYRVGDTECMLLVDNGEGKNAAPDQIMGAYEGDADLCLALYYWGYPWKDFQGNIQITT